MSSKQFTNNPNNRESKPRRVSLSRRHFLLGMAAISATAIIPSAISCSATPIYDIHNQLTDTDFATLIAVQNHLFPKGDNSPGAEEIHAAPYFCWCLMDSEEDEEVTQKLRDGLKWIEEESQKLFSEKFIDLDQPQKEQALRSLEEKGYGSSWISLVLTKIFEALLSDPIYGSNTNSTGWKWLEHTPGMPRPTSKNTYKNIVKW